MEYTLPLGVDWPFSGFSYLSLGSLAEDPGPCASGLYPGPTPVALPGRAFSHQLISHSRTSHLDVKEDLRSG